MKLCRFVEHQQTHARFGLVEGAEIQTLPADFAFERLESAARTRGAATVPLDAVRLIAPVAPSKIVCVGRNYRDHAAELGNPMPAEPLLFLKPPSAVVGQDDVIELPRQSARVEYEGELGVVIGRRARRLSETDDPLAYVFGYTCVNDVTARDLQRQDVQFTRAKSFDTFCPVGPFVVDDIDPLDVNVETRLDGEVRQSARTSVMAFSVPFLIRYISHVMTLEPGDLISTGTPAGVGAMRDGQTVEVEVEGIGVLRNVVRASQE
jgi:2-keto-4-pentenoate hydratase/2-oxohepta-3-ene-1,7-dioic acid hydratase in catechol pathway